MNAYELADFIDGNDCEYLDLNSISKMLRMQQNLILKLEAKLNFYAPKDEEGDFKTLSRKELLDYIEYLRKQIK